jgi:hypothetical protein
MPYPPGAAEAPLTGGGAIPNPAVAGGATEGGDMIAGPPDGFIKAGPPAPGGR